MAKCKKCGLVHPRFQNGNVKRTCPSGAGRPIPAKGGSKGGRKTPFGGAFKDAFTGADRLPNSVKSVLSKYGDETIKSIKVCRLPIKKALMSIINAITLGSIKSQQEKLHYDNLVHLYMVITLENGTTVSLEKNEIIMSSINPTIKEGSECVNVPINKNILLGELVQKAINKVGNDIFHYDIINSNCQIFTIDVLQANGLLTPQLRAFIQQDVATIVQNIPKPAMWLAGKVVRLVERLRYLTGEGKGALPLAPSFRQPIRIPRPPIFKLPTPQRLLLK